MSRARPATSSETAGKRESMSRAADYSINGFLYQFNKSLIEILGSAQDDVIALEGTVEDIEVHSASGMTATQCKYHEAAESFAPSSIYKPVLQMMEHFRANPQAQVRYVLFCHYPDMHDAPERTVLRQYAKESLESKNLDLKKLVTGLNGNVDIDGFLGQFSMAVGPKLDTLAAQACAALEINGIPKGDIDTLAYPNAIQLIAVISAKHNPADRKITKREFIERLRKIRKTAISRWTMALRTRKQLLDTRRKQLKAHLDLNARLRYFVIETGTLEDFEVAFVLFVKDFIGKYHFKQSHIGTPLFCLSVTKDKLNDIESRLYKAGIKTSTGYRGGEFEESDFFREPLCKSAKGQTEREFHLRLLRSEDHLVLLNSQRCDDLFILGEPDISLLKTEDVNVEHLAITSFKEVEYLMGVGNVYE